ncbi:hypothetical protein [Pseudomonas sp. PH1b]|uniref:hypothetical protein n=1 Tax=Pseudomonas sp. PH1b TaxID=1397282 RepID=UPI00046874D7|nr:hypothetical protein [Pseudomonas sp. PH1b]BFD44150.1 hypothetical protein FFPRI1PSEUD_56490 [Pseudomonas sp. FFPRI_1]
MRFHSLLLLGLTLGLGGCTYFSTLKATAVSYRGPAAAADTALIRIVAQGLVRGVPDSDCIDWRKPGSGLMVRPHRGIANPNFRNLGIAMTAETDRMRRQEGFGANELRLPANRPFAFQFYNTEPGMNRDYRAVCEQSVTFIPEPGATYQMVFLQDGMCTALLRKIDDQGRMQPGQVGLKPSDYCSADARLNDSR